MIAFVWAQSQNGIIGNHGGLPWKMPADMHHFKTTTTGHLILAGRATFESFGRPLPNRTNMVLTHHAPSKFPAGVVVFNDVAAFLADYKQRNEDVYVVGGAKVFQALMDYVDCLYRTVIDTEIDGDTQMPPIDYSQFELLATSSFDADEKNQYPYTFETYRKLK
ncbi:dihydrofolate reductase [Nicoliella spurrieriana]|uniref:Dihydrofolate reductase n=1 Tax=Nicoliella spurrieriana TaxID=2925830 RepID=A0A976RRM9_9LACO|nr:dihydrofolate reductase [Nicoliella spurrieriana]UQS86572.1 dihydrofolate reductase [Nicoliella spurrieriana]